MLFKIAGTLEQVEQLLLVDVVNGDEAATVHRVCRDYLQNYKIFSSEPLYEAKYFFTLSRPDVKGRPENTIR